jgi:hypothetical protein
MVWSVCLLGEGVDGVTQRIDLLALGAVPSPNDIDEIGVTQTTGRRLLSELQQAVVTLQEAALRAAAKERTATTSDLTLKDYRLRKVQTLFGTVSLRVPRLVNQGRIESVLPTSCGARSTRAFDDLRNKLSAWMSFRSAMALLGEMYPVEDGKSAQTAMRQIATAAERQDNAPLCDVSLDDARIALPLDTTFVRATRMSTGVWKSSSALSLKARNLFAISPLLSSRKTIVSGSARRSWRPAVRAKSRHSVTALDPFARWQSPLVFRQNQSRTGSISLCGSSMRSASPTRLRPQQSPSPAPMRQFRRGCVSCERSSGRAILQQSLGPSGRSDRT